jgi:hypothetical protein
MRSLGELYNFDAKERKLRCCPNFIHLTVQAILYGLGSKAIKLRKLLGQYSDQNFDDSKNTTAEVDGGEDDNADDALFTAFDELSMKSEVEIEADADSTVEDDDDYDTQVPAITATVPTHIATTSLATYRRDGPFGKLHPIGVLFCKSSQLKDTFFAAQLAIDPDQQPLAWIHNVVTRWSSDYAMAERALTLRRALQRLFIDVEEQWHHRGSVASQRPELLAYKLTASEWQIVTALQHILKQFAIATDQLQGDPLRSHQTPAASMNIYQLLTCSLAISKQR